MSKTLTSVLKTDPKLQESAEVQRLKKMIKVLKGGGKAEDLDDQVYLTERIYELVLESQLPHKIVNLLSTIAD